MKSSANPAPDRVPNPSAAQAYGLDRRLQLAHDSPYRQETPGSNAFPRKRIVYGHGTVRSSNASPSAVPIAWVVLGGALIPVLVVAGQTSHELLRVVVCNVN